MQGDDFEIELDVLASLPRLKEELMEFLCFLQAVARALELKAIFKLQSHKNFEFFAAVISALDPRQASGKDLFMTSMSHVSLL